MKAKTGIIVPKMPRNNHAISLSGRKLKLFASRIRFGVPREDPAAVRTTSSSRQPAGTAMIAAKMAKRKTKLCAPSHRHELKSAVFRFSRQLTRSRTKKTSKINPTVVDHGRQQCCNVQENGTPLRKPSNNGGPTGKSA